MAIDHQFRWIRKNAASRIDRLLIDKELLLAFPHSKAYCRNRVFSDHFPIIFKSFVVKWNPAPFRTLDCWLGEPSFEKVFRKEWMQLNGQPLVSKLKMIKTPIKAWNKGVFGNIDSKLCLYKEAIRKLDEEAQKRNLDECEWARLDALRSQLWHWMIRKERYWRQLSRCKVMMEGDRNTKYFHLKATMRRKRNMIDKLLINGEEVTDMKVVKSHIIRHFKMSYKKQKSVSFDLSTLGLPQLSQEDAEMLESPVTRQEIKEALLSCDPSKAPGYDGFNLKCIRKMWSTIGEDFYSCILDFFENGRLHCSFNTTWVILIPKKKGVLEVNDFRPISLVGSVYKIIAKVLSKRLRRVLPSLIGETQSAFVEGRQIFDGALIAIEVVQWLKIKKKEGVLLKLDFQKAYDTIDWSSLELVQQEMGFGRK